mmetsp:Transcript_27163/g.45212  ORF Transcript_27163/g.45212 Transcript_27163/m.45212 type:complete len:80 (-) Transcript_27163:660-899(-)
MVDPLYLCRAVQPLWMKVGVKERVGTLDLDFGLSPATHDCYRIAERKEQMASCREKAAFNFNVFKSKPNGDVKATSSKQ